MFQMTNDHHMPIEALFQELEERQLRSAPLRYVDGWEDPSLCIAEPLSPNFFNFFFLLIDRTLVQSVLP